MVKNFRDVLINYAQLRPQRRITLSNVSEEMIIIMSQTAKNKAVKIVARLKKRAREKVESVSHIYMDNVYCWTLNLL